MNSVLIFIAGFISALVLVGAVIMIGGIWWFLSYGRHLQEKRQKEAILAASPLRQSRRAPIIGDNDPL